MPLCWQCEKPFDPVRKKQRFCCPEHRIEYNNDRKGRKYVLVERNDRKILDLANGQDKPANEFLNEFLTRYLNPNEETLTEDEVYGIKVGTEL